MLTIPIGSNKRRTPRVWKGKILSNVYRFVRLVCATDQSVVQDLTSSRAIPVRPRCPTEKSGLSGTMNFCRPEKWAADLALLNAWHPVNFHRSPRLFPPPNVQQDTLNAYGELTFSGKNGNDAGLGAVTATATVTVTACNVGRITHPTCQTESLRQYAALLDADNIHDD